MKNRLGDAKDLVAAGLHSADALLIFESNVTPKMSVNLAATLAPGQPPKTAIRSANKLALRLIQPEIEITTLDGALRKSFAPYGRPRANGFVILLFSMATAGVLGAGIAWNLCRKINNKAI